MERTKRIIVLLIILAVCFTPSFAYAKGENTMSKSNSIIEVKINEKLDELIASIEDKDRKEAIYNFFYLPAYSKTTIYTSRTEAETDADVEKMVNQSEKNYQIAKKLLTLDKAAFDRELEKLIKDGAVKISKMRDIIVEDAYLDYIEPYTSKDILSVLKNKTSKDAVSSSFATEDMIKDKSSALSITRDSGQQSFLFKKEYGSASTIEYTMFQIKVTWRYSNGVMTGIDTDQQMIVTPVYVFTSLVRSEKYRRGPYGYVQRGWAYRHSLNSSGQPTGYYIIDIKLKLRLIDKKNLTTLSPNQWSIYSWG